MDNMISAGCASIYFGPRYSSKYNLVKTSDLNAHNNKSLNKPSRILNEYKEWAIKANQDIIKVTTKNVDLRIRLLQIAQDQK